MAVARLAIIGVGQIGLRHLQALALIDRDTYIQVVDPSEQALDRAKKEFTKLSGSTKVKKIDFLQNIDSLSTESDLIIVATNSAIRQIIIKDILEQKKVRYLILEKFLFQKKEHFVEIAELIEKKKVSVWVNCPLRMLTFYKELKQMLKGSKTIDYQVSYSNLGIGTNAIHHIDLFAYLTDQTEFRMDSSYLDQKIIPSKRPGFIEFVGTLTGVADGGHRITIISYPDGNVPPLVQINSDKVRCMIRENERKAFISGEKNGWNWEEIPYIHPYQSELTHLAVQQILDTGSSDLTPYLTSWKLHLPLLDAFMEHLQKNSEEEVVICPIT